MAYTVDILNNKLVAENGLLSKIEIGGKVYKIRYFLGSVVKKLEKISAFKRIKHFYAPFYCFCNVNQVLSAT